RPEVRHFTANPAAPHPRLEHLFHTSCKHGYRFDGTVGGEIEKRHGSNVDCGLRIADCGLGVWTRPSYACFNRMLKPKGPTHASTCASAFEVRRRIAPPLSVGCWMFEVGCWMFAARCPPGALLEQMCSRDGNHDHAQCKQHHATPTMEERIAEYHQAHRVDPCHAERAHEVDAEGHTGESEEVALDEEGRPRCDPDQQGYVPRVVPTHFRKPIAKPLHELREP